MWIADTCVLIDIFQDHDGHGIHSGQCLHELIPEGVAVCPVTIVEMAPSFDGRIELQKSFLAGCHISFTEPWTIRDTETAHEAWARVTAARRHERLPRRPVADILIGAFAANRTGLVTRNPEDFRRWFPKLRLKVPAHPR